MAIREAMQMTIVMAVLWGCIGTVLSLRFGLCLRCFFGESFRQSLGRPSDGSSGSHRGHPVGSALGNHRDRLLERSQGGRRHSLRRSC